MPENVIDAIGTTCYHCGEDEGTMPVLYDDKAFCCEGCKMVYSILQENNLCTYYELNQSSGISFKERSIERYSHLDNQDVIEKVIDFSDGIQSRVHFYLPQIHCSSCLWLLENLNRLNPAILQSRVNFLKKEVSIQYDQKETSLRKIVEMLATVGYAPALGYDKLGEKRSSAQERSLYYKIGLAGFAFGNIMLLSFPEYLGLDAHTEGDFVQFFGYLNLILVLPVLLYSGQDYLRSALQGLRQKHLNIDVPVSLGILALFGRSAFEILTHSGAGYLDSLAGLIFFLLVGKWFQTKIYHTISFDRDYKSYFPMASNVIRNGEEQSITLDDVEVGDELIIRNGELIPADATLLEGAAEIDYSFVTGESRTITVQLGEKVFAGGRQQRGTIHIQVIAKVAQSYLTSLWNEEVFTKRHQVGLTSKLADRVATFFTGVILLVAFSTLVYWLPHDLSIAFNAFTSVLIVACPCAVALSIPFTFGNTLRLLGNQHFYLKNTGVIEEIASATHIVFDKTGTITTNRGAVLQYHGTPLSKEEHDLVLSLAHHSAHPKSRQIEKTLKGTGSYLPVRHYQSHTGEGIEGMVLGRRVMLGAHRFVMPSSGKTSLERGTWVCIDDDVKGCYSDEAQYRKGLSQVIDLLKHRFKLSILSGDDDLEAKKLREVFGHESNLRFHQSPQDKLKAIHQLQNQGEKVIMIGDGLNDAGALKQSDIGIAVSDEVNSFIPACDAVLDAAQFIRLPNFVRFCSQSIGIVYLSYFVALLYNIVGLSFAVRGLLSPVIAAILMPLSSITIVALGMGLSSIAAFRLGINGESTQEDDQGHRSAMTFVINQG
ncbi:MAG: HAD-IC family P-type ATPase [Saprospiraceae bacterium]|nr:HAD-IC family P-type ATPase [Saprospiraceae bacterium]